MSINSENIIEIHKNLNKYPETKLLIVTKNQDLNDINVLISEGYRLFGENRVQEAYRKYSQIDINNDLELHLIGPLQRNKVKQALKIFDTIQTIDRFSLVDEISKQINNLPDLKTRDFYIQVNIGEEEQKFGVSKKELKELYSYSIEKKVSISGLMCIPPNTSDPSIFFREMLDLKNNINQNLKLSMGMSGDYKFALNFQTNFIRIGSLIFR